jgi:hypothetical protein
MQEGGALRPETDEPFSSNLISGSIPSSHITPMNPQALQSDEKQLSIEDLWTTTLKQNKSFKEIKDAIEREDRRLPLQLKLQITMAECSLDDKGRPRFRERL